MAFMIIPFMTQLGSTSRTKLQSGMVGGAAGAVFQVCAIIIISVSYTHLDVYKRQDGRLAGTPLADNASPMAGMDVNGPTAVVNSLACCDELVPQSGMPVSYTHLDVYKRQLQYCPLFVFH